MPKHTLFVCKSCHRSSKRRPKNPPFDGDILIDELNNLCAEKFSSEEIEIQPVECLWACNQGCVVAVSSHEKPTYLFVNLTPEKSTPALIEFMQLYIKSSKGALVWEQLPKLLKSAIFTQIPPINS
jgi:predicted metal-binding protein